MEFLELEESTDSACRTLSYFFSKEENPSRKEIRDLILRDLCWRIPEAEPLERAIILSETLINFLPKEIRNTFQRNYFKLNELDKLREHKKIHVDVGIVTIIDTELKAVLTVLGVDPEKKADANKGSFSYWFAEIKRPTGNPVKVVVTYVGEARNVPCAIAVECLLQRFSVNALILIGIAAGPKSKVKMGDVVIADQIYDYEEHRLEVIKFFGILTKIRTARRRPKYIATKKVVRGELKRINPKRFIRQFEEVSNTINDDLLPRGYPKGNAPEIHGGTIAAGEKLFADGSVEKMRKFDERIRAASMEDSGFAQVAESKGLAWCVFRGISDFGDPYKGNNWQFIATTAAASAAVTFLKYVWEPQDS